MNFLLTIFIRKTVFYYSQKKKRRKRKEIILNVFTVLFNKLTMKSIRKFFSTGKKNLLQCLINPKNKKK